MIAAIVALGLGPIVVIALASLFITIALDLEREGGATAAAVVGAAIVLWLTETNPLPWLRTHIGTTLIGLLGYFIVGFAWSLIKWYFYLLNLRDRGIRTAPRVEQHKTRILGWMTYWPWSAFWTLLRDPVKRVWRAIYARTAEAFQGISNRIFPSAGDPPGA